MKSISIDLESFSSVNLGKSGVYKYCESDDFEILLFGYSVDGKEVQVVDLTNGEKIPAEIISALTDDSIQKYAYNSQFERVCLSKWLGMPSGEYLSPKSWNCTMVWAATLGLPLSLAGVGAVLGLEKQKLAEGKNLIRYFCIPCSPTKTNGGRTRNLPEHDIEKWEQFKEYNIRDVETEMEIQAKIANFPVLKSEWGNYHLDQIINDRGIALDIDFISQAVLCDEKIKTENMERAKKLTGLENPNSPMQLRDWLEKQGIITDSLTKDVVSKLLEGAKDEVHEVLSIRQQLAKSSVKKYTAMENVVCKDSRARGLIQFYGANRTGRYAGRLIQVQNLTRNNMPDLKEARDLVRSANFIALELLYDNIPNVLSELIRTAFVPKKGHRFIVADFSSIERVVLAWIAGEQWVLEAYKNKRDLYIATASQMFGVPIEQIDKKDPLRQKGKVADLACIAEGQLVLTDTGLIPIEKITLNHKVWDGKGFVNHDGVIYKGERSCINAGGVTCTPDHKLLTIKGWMESGKSDGLDWADVRIPEDFIANREVKTREITVKTCKAPRRNVYDILNCGDRNRFAVWNGSSLCLVHNCGYGGSVGALKAMGAIQMGLAEEELKPLVDAWRLSNPNITKLWWDVDRMAKAAIKGRTTTSTHGIDFIYQSGILFIKLPSGRKLAYIKPRIGENRFGGESVTYEGVGATKKWERIESYGPKFVENIVQAISRDILAEVMINLADNGYKIVMHVHDEVVLEVPIGESSVEEICKMISITPKWADGLLLDADGFECEFYQKD